MGLKRHHRIVEGRTYAYQHGGHTFHGNASRPFLQDGVWVVRLHNLSIKVTITVPVDRLDLT